MEVTLLDHVSDRGGVELVRLAAEHVMPDFVKRADLTELCRERKGSLSIYGDPVNKRYPCDDSASTWLSHLYFLDKKAAMHPKTAAKIDQRLRSYATYWGISGDADRLRASMDVTEKRAAAELPDSEYAVVWRFEDGSQERHLPLTNAAEVKAAAEWLPRYRDRFAYEDRRKIALKILDKAAAYGATVGDNLDFLERTAGRGVCVPAKVAMMLERRAFLAVNEEMRGEIRKLASLIREKPRECLQPHQLTKLAQVVDDIDRRIGVFGKWQTLTPAPEDVLFEVSFTKAAADLKTACALQTGAVYEREQLSKLALHDLQTVFGTDFTNEVRSGLDVDVEKLAELLPTLPTPDAELFDKLMLDHRQGPRMRKTAAASVGFTNEQWRSLAKCG